MAFKEREYGSYVTCLSGWGNPSGVYLAWPADRVCFRQVTVRVKLQKAAPVVGVVLVGLAGFPLQCVFP